MTQRFTQAIEQLGQTGRERLDVRIGGAYALEQIARDSAELHWPIVEILTAFIREHASKEAEWSPPPGRRSPADIQAALTVIGRRPTEQDQAPLDLRTTNLYGADLRGANLQGAILERAILRLAYLQEANLEGADLTGAELQGAELQAASLKGAHLELANLEVTAQ